MKLIPTYSILRKKQQPEADYFSHRLAYRFLHVLGVGIQQAAREHAQTIAEANLKAGKEIGERIRSGFEAVNQQQKEIHQALTHQTQVIETGLIAIDETLESGFSKTLQGLNEVANRIDQNSLAVVQAGDRLFQGIAGLKAGMDMGMANILTQFELERQEIRQGFDLLADILENQRKSEARERYRDGKAAYEQYLQHPDEPQFLTDAKDYLEQSTQIYRGNPFCHLYLGHIFQEPAQFYDLDKAQQHYQLCATYAKGIPNEGLTALGYFLAAWIAYVRENVSEAIDLAEKSLAHDPDHLPENYYNLAKYRATQGEGEAALGFLETAIRRFDPTYALKADVDPDFAPVRKDLDPFFVRLRDEEAQKMDDQLAAFGLDSPPRLGPALNAPSAAADDEQI